MSRNVTWCGGAENRFVTRWTLTCSHWTVRHWDTSASNVNILPWASGRRRVVQLCILPYHVIFRPMEWTLDNYAATEWYHSICSNNKHGSVAVSVGNGEQMTPIVQWLMTLHACISRDGWWIYHSQDKTSPFWTNIFDKNRFEHLHKIETQSITNAMDGWISFCSVYTCIIGSSTIPNLHCPLPVLPTPALYSKDKHIEVA